jgi:hypothetical protein
VWLSECEWEDEHPPYNSDSQITNTKIINVAFTKTHERYTASSSLSGFPAVA